MNRLVTLSVATLLSIGIMQAKAADFPQEPYVGYGSGFTLSGTGKTVNSASALASAAKSGGKITVSGKLSNALVVCGSNTHIVGDGTAVLEKVSFLIMDAKNVTIQNLTMHLPYSGTVKGSDHDGDVIHIEGSGSSNIWIDHCDISTKYDGVGKDTYDGLIDVKNGPTNITISWNYIHDSHKCNLNGHTNKDNSGKWNLSMHHNIFNKVGSRIPSVRSGKAAVFNNYYLLVPNTAINTRMGAEVYCEKNYFEGVGSGKKEDLGYDEGPIGTYYDDVKGAFNAVDNYYLNCKGSQPTNAQSTTSYKPSFAGKETIPVMDVPKVLLEKAGVGGKKKNLVYPEGHTRTIRVAKSVVNTQIVTPSALYNTLGVKISNGKTNPKDLANSVYIAKENGRSVVRLNTAH